MKYNLTPLQKEAAKWIVAQIRAGKVGETFFVITVSAHGAITRINKSEHLAAEWRQHISGSQLDALAHVQLLRVNGAAVIAPQREPGSLSTTEYVRTCTLTGAIYEAVDSDFREDAPAQPISTLAQPHPPEIAMSLDRFRSVYPDPKKVGFLIMRFAAAKPFGSIVEVIKQAGQKHGLEIVRADEHEFHADLWGNVRTYLHGCGFGIAVYERIESDEPNANVGLEVGYLLAMNKPVLLLKDRTVQTLQADLAGKLYRPFDPHDPATTIPEHLEKWLADNGVVLAH